MFDFLQEHRLYLPNLIGKSSDLRAFMKSPGLPTLFKVSFFKKLLFLLSNEILHIMPCFFYISLCLQKA